MSTNPKDALGDAKVDVSLVPPSSIIYQALAMQDGAKKYEPYNWRGKEVRARVYVAAALRHIFAWLDGEESSADANVPHLGHALACLGILVDASTTGNLIDDRPCAGASAALFTAYTRKQDVVGRVTVDDKWDGTCKPPAHDDDDVGHTLPTLEAINKELAEAEAQGITISCWSCGADANTNTDYCYGCKRIVCDPCAFEFDHYGDAAHGSKRGHGPGRRSADGRSLPRIRAANRYVD